MNGEGGTYDFKTQELNRHKIESARKGILGFFVARYRVTILIILGIAVWGIFASLTLPREANPEVKVPYAMVTALFPGASPSDVEELVTDKIEERIQNVENIKLITSTSRLSLSSIFVEFEASADLDKSISDLKDAVDSVTGLPDAVENPTVAAISFNNQSVVTFSLIGNRSDEELSMLAEDVGDQLEAIAGVSEVRLIGTRTREITVELDPSSLARLNLSTSRVVSSIRGANTSLPAGEVTVGDLNYNARVTGSFKSAEDVGSVVVLSGPNGLVLVRDIAKVTERLETPTSFSRVSVQGAPPSPAVSLSVSKRTGGNIIEIVDAARERLAELQASGTIPEDIEITTTNDLSQFIRRDFSILTSSAFQTVIIIFVLLTAALSLRKAITATISIPLIFLMALGILSLTGSTLNSLVLFSLVLSMGLLIDTIIVVLEGIHDGLKQGLSSQDAALYSLATYKWPVISGVLTTIAAFLPMFLVSGILGEFLKTLPITIAATLGSSLFVGLFVMPGLSAFLQKDAKLKAEKDTFLEKYVTNRLTAFYSRTLNSLLLSRRKKWRFLGLLCAGFFVSVAIVATGLIPVQLFPNVDVDTFFISVESPVGSTLASTDKITREVENKIASIPEIENFATSVGVAGSSGDPFAASGGQSNSAEITVNLVERDSREKKSYEIAEDIRTRLLTVDGAEVIVAELDSGPPTGAPVEIRILGDDLNLLALTESKVIEALKSISGVINIESSRSTASPEFEFVLKHELLGRYGLSAIEVAQEVRTSVDGITATAVSTNGDEEDVVVRLPEGKFVSTESILAITIPTSQGNPVILSELVDFEVVPALESIPHRGLKRIISISADLEGITVAAAQQMFEERIKGQIDNGTEIQFGGEVEDIEQSFTELWYSMSVAVILILFIMVLQFDSFLQPFIIILTLPLAVIGVVIGTLALGLDFGFATFLGIVALAGIVVNDAIILIDRINYNVRVVGMQARKAVADAGISRLEPIMMTTLTTIAGVTPLAFADEFWRGLSIAIAFGIAFATFLTLGLVPILYLKLSRKFSK